METGARAVACRRLPGVLGGLDLLHADFRQRQFPPHFHDDYTFGLVTRGVNRFRYGRRHLEAPAGTICLALPGEIHTGDAGEVGWTYWTVHVPATAMRALAAEAGIAGDPAFASGVIDDAGAARRLAAFFGGNGADPLLAHEVRAVEALGGLIRRHANAAIETPVPALASRVRDLLADRAADTVTLADLEAETGVGRYRLIRAFRAAYGLPPHAWQTQVRLARAKALIAAGTPLAEAAAAAGFADQAHMTRLFRRVLGCTPGAYARA
jgi:AraC-like DNA-binding protein